MGINVSDPTTNGSIEKVQMLEKCLTAGINRKMGTFVEKK